MPWKEENRVDLRMRFVSRLLEGNSMSDLCREFDISRKTGYKILARYEQVGVRGLEDMSRARKNMPNKTLCSIEQLIIGLRNQQKNWGPKKIKARLEELHPGVAFPAQSTIGEILERNGLVKKRRKRFKRIYHASDLTNGQFANHVWCIDFKGQFRLGDKSYCYPLTITDHFSRALIGCEALQNTGYLSARGVCEEVFDEYGLPEIIRSDNGTPFASGSSLDGLSRLSAWWLWIGIQPERIEPGCPEQNGTHERFHLTLKQETTNPARANMFQQQETFDTFKEVYNDQRPHEALGQKTPSKFYQKSSRSFSEVKPFSYDQFDEVRKVSKDGMIRTWKGERCFVTRALHGHKVGLKRLDTGDWLINFAGHDIGHIAKRGNTLIREQLIL